MIRRTNNPRRTRAFLSLRNRRGRIARRRLAHEPLERRLVLDSSGFPGNFCPPDLDLSGIDPQSARIGEELVLDLLASGGIVTDLDANDEPTGDTIQFQLDPDDTPAGATISPGGVFRWTPTADQTGTFEFVVLAADSGDPPLADAEVFTVTVEPNHAPDLEAIPNAGVGANETLEVALTASDEDGDELTFQLDRDDPGSTLPEDAEIEQLDNTTAVVRWTPGDADIGETFTFAVIVTDDGIPPLSDREVFTVSVMSVAAVDDAYQTDVDEALTVEADAGVLANDTDSDGDPLTAVLVANPTGGTLMLASDGSFTYTPNSGFRGTDSFTYRADDGTGDSDEAVVTIQVNADPVADDDVYEVDEDMTLTVDAASGVLENDSDADGDPLTATLVNDVSNGSVTLNSDGSFTYTPDADFSGADSFTYRASDGIAVSADATVTVTVNAVNDPPEAVTDTYSVDENATLEVDAASGVLANDSDTEDDVLSATLVETTSNGTLTLNSDGSFTYAPAADFNGSDEFTYVANDGVADSQSTTVSITVNLVNSAPESVADEYSVVEDSSLSVDAAMGVLANDTDADGDGLAATLVDDVTNGTLTLSDDGSFTYTPDANFSGTDSFTYTATDGVATSGATAVTIDVVEQNMFSVAENAPAGTVVGQVSPEGDLGTTTVFTIEDPDLDDALELAADDHVEGNPAAPAVLIEYVDFQCPVCRTYEPIVEQLLEDSPDDVLVVTRHFPLITNHQNALDAAIATEAAGRQGAFHEYGDLLFEEQDAWESATDPQPLFEDYAVQLDPALDLDQFRSDQADPALMARVQRDYNAILALGGTGTPTFFLNGEQISPGPSLAEFTPLIQAAVNEAEGAFAIDRLTGEIIVRDSAALDFETNPSLTLTVNAIGLEETESIVATINVLDVAEGQSQAATPESLDSVFEEEANWLHPLGSSL